MMLNAGQDTSNQDEEWTHRLAIHEAGHAVSCFVNGVGFDFVKIMPHRRTKRCGLTKARIATDTTSPSKTYRDLLILLAGYCAERIKFGNGIREGAIVDVQKAYCRTLGITSNEKECSRLMKDVRDSTEKLLKDNWTLVEKLADRLVENYIITGSEAIKMFMDKQ